MGNAAVDGVKLLEQLILFDITYDVVPDNYLFELGGIEASWRPDERCISITQSTYDRLVRGDGRAPYTICHELGHCELGHQSPPLLLHRNEPSHKRFEDTEWQADQFSAEMVMPLPVILQERIETADGIRRRFGVSMQAAEIRLERLRKEGCL